MADDVKVRGFGLIHTLSHVESDVRRKVQQARHEAWVVRAMVEDHMPNDPDGAVVLGSIEAHLKALDGFLLELTGGI